ncbi:MAG: hypothetical protein AB7O73_12260 [Bacteroidia bacterium]
MKKGIWIDGTVAKIVDPTNGIEKTIESNIENKVHNNYEGERTSMIDGRHVPFEKKFEERKKHQINDYLKNVCSELKSVTELYLFGPAEMKTHLKTRINEDKNFKLNIFEVRNADYITDNQIVAEVKDFFENQDK